MLKFLQRAVKRRDTDERDGERVAPSSVWVQIDQSRFAIVDLSARGFRIIDYSGDLIQGQTVHFRFIIGEGDECEDLPAIGHVERLDENGLGARLISMQPFYRRILNEYLTGLAPV